jgi:hypothetical protein
MIINFKIRKISRDICKLARTPALIKKNTQEKIERTKALNGR